jgi:hypothetical protein
MLRNSSENVNRKPGRFRHVATDEIDLPVHQVRDESYIAGKAIEFRNHELSPVLATCGQRCRKLGPIAPAAGLNLDKFGEQLPAASLVRHRRRTTGRRHHFCNAQSARYRCRITGSGRAARSQ